MCHAGSWHPDRELNPGPLHWTCGVLTTGPLGKSPWGILNAGRMEAVLGEWRVGAGSRPRPSSVLCSCYALGSVHGPPQWFKWQSICLQCGRPRFSPWVGKIPWSRKWQPTPVFLPGKFHRQRIVVGYCPRGRKDSAMTERRSTHVRCSEPRCAELWKQRLVG